jgi:tetratricopeptide (TPR) repeat protein
MKSFTKEMLILAVALAISAVLCYLGTSQQGVGPAVRTVPQTGSRTEQVSGLRSLPEIPDRFELFHRAGSPNPFVYVSQKREIPPDDLAPPPFALLPVSIPPMRPWPQGPAGMASPRLKDPASALPKQADLLTADAMASLLAIIGAPPTLPGPDKEERTREFDTVWTKNGKVDGKIISEDAQFVRIRTKQGNMIKIAVADITKEIERSLTMAELYVERFKVLPRTDVAKRRELAAWCVEKGLMQEAVTEYEAITAARGAGVEDFMKLASIYRRNCDLDSEMRTYERALAALPSDGDAVRLRMAELYELLGLRAEAVKCIEKVTEQWPGNAQARIALARVYSLSGRLQEAAKQLERAKSLAPNDPALGAVQGQLALAKGDVPSAVAALEAAQKSGRADGETLNALGVAYFLGGSWDKAATTFQEVLKADTVNSNAACNLGIMYLCAGLYDDADKIFTAAANGDPTSASALLGIAACRHMQGNVEKAFEMYRKAADAEPGFANAHCLLGRLSLEQGDLEMSRQCHRTAVACDPTLQDSLHDLGAVLCLERVQALVKRPETAAVLAQALMGSGKLKDAEALLGGIQPPTASVLSTLGCIAYMDKRPQDAIKLFQDACKISPNDAYATAALKLVTLNASRSLWEDDFNRPDRDDPGRGWMPAENFGIDVKISGGRLLFEGTQTVEDWGTTAMERAVRGETFVRFEATLDLSKSSGARAGIRVTARRQENTDKAGLFLLVDDNGQLAVASSSNVANPLDLKQIGAPADISDVRLTIEKSTNSRGEIEYVMMVDGEQKHVLKGEALANMPNLVVGVFGQAPRQTEWQARVKKARIIEKKASDSSGPKRPK